MAKPSSKIAPLVPVVRHDGWTTERQVRFLRALAETHSVSKAAQVAGMSRQSAYRLRARLRAEPFGMAWDAAFLNGFDRLAEAAPERAINGVEVPHYHKGELIGTSRRYDERLTVALLAMRESFLRAPASPLHDASAYEVDDFRSLLERVEDGPMTWDGYDLEDEGDDAHDGEEGEAP